MYRIHSKNLSIACLKQNLKTLLKEADEMFQINNPNIEDEFKENPMVLETLYNFIHDEDKCFEDTLALLLMKSTTEHQISNQK